MSITTLFYLAIAVVTIAVRIISEKKKNDANEDERLQRSSGRQSEGSSSASGNAPKSLQDLIRQFEEAQRDAGDVNPSVPPDPEDNYEETELPVVEPAKPGLYTFEEIAQSVVQWEVVSVELLEQAFNFSESTAMQVLQELQARHIVGRDMGEGECDLLVHDKVELTNLFNREAREAREREAAKAQENALKAQREAKIRQQKELAELEERARQIREQAGQINDGTEEVGVPCLASGEHKTRVRPLDRSEIRRGFIWAKVLDEPRFKRKWSSKVR